ncbi:MAG: hypothetical protein Q7U18_06520 [Methylobacter sp.]|nr:hypothetical protein [Methylobacter sp.]
MNIAETIYQHVKAMEVLHFVEFLETKPDFIAKNATENIYAKLANRRAYRPGN